MNCHRDISIKNKAKTGTRLQKWTVCGCTNWKYLVWLRLQLQIQTQNKNSYIRNC